jgi:hypothetical protein
VRVLHLQGLVDELCLRLGRSVAIDNRHVEVIAASAQIGEVDDARREAIMVRQTDPRIVEYVLGLAPPSGAEGFAVPPHPTMGTLPRWCTVLRGESNELLGYLWIIDVPALSPEEKGLVAEYASLIREALVVSLSHVDATVQALVEVTSALLGGDGDAVERAGRSGLLARSGEAAVWAMRVGRGAESRVSAVELEALLKDVVSSTYPGSFVGAAVDDVLVLVTRGRRTVAEEASVVGAVRLSCQRRRLQLGGVGMAVLDPAVPAELVLERARFGARLSALDGEAEAKRWEGLGAWGLLLGKPWTLGTVAEVSPGVAALVERGAALWETALAYLDLAGNAARTCEALHIHRATLYYRLDRIREVAGANMLDDGWARSSAHVALRLWEAMGREGAAVAV